MDHQIDLVPILKAGSGVATGDPLPTNTIEITANGAILHRPVSTDFIAEQWYALAAKLGLDADKYELRAYMSGWWPEYERTEFKYLQKVEIWDFDDGWATTQDSWFQPPDARYTCQWAVELVRHGIDPTFQAERAWPELQFPSDLPSGPAPEEEPYPAEQLLTLTEAALRAMPRKDYVRVGRTLDPMMMLQFMTDDLALHTIAQLLHAHQEQTRH